MAIPATQVPSVIHRLRAWLEHWGPILPLLIAESTIWLGFGALLPILPIYYTRHGVDLPTLGVVVAAWPAARLFAEPVFGWVADRASRKRMMITGLLLAAVVAVLPLFWVGPFAFIVARALAGMFAAVYDPAARGYLVDANPPEKQGETFGLYGSAQTGGFMVGPAVGGLAAAAAGDPTVVFWVCGIALLVSAVLVAWRLPERARIGGHEPAPVVAGEPGPGNAPSSIMNRLFFVAVVLNVAAFLAGGTYEVVWSLYLTSLGASIAVIGVSFFTFALPVMLLSPFTGRYVDRHGGYLALTIGLAGVALCGIGYTLIPSVLWVVLLGLVEGSAFAFASPALFLLVSRASPAGRASTAQGIFGAAGTMGTVVASITAGAMAQVDLRLPFIATGTTALVVLVLGVALGGRRLWPAMQPSHLDPTPDPARSAAAEPADGTS
jgi:DHA1 family multidrug resistance protein-like MFS transporter